MMVPFDYFESAPGLLNTNYLVEWDRGGLFMTYMGEFYCDIVTPEEKVIWN